MALGLGVGGASMEDAAGMGDGNVVGVSWGQLSGEAGEWLWTGVEGGHVVGVGDEFRWGWVWSRDGKEMEWEEPWGWGWGQNWVWCWLWVGAGGEVGTGEAVEFRVR